MRMMGVMGTMIVCAGMAAADGLPIREITVFKDGHAFVAHAGTMQADASGEVMLDSLPMPVLGTFWPFSANSNVPLTSATAGPRIMSRVRSALTLKELVEANVGGTVVVKEIATMASYHATILAIPREDGTGAVRSSYVLLKTDDGVKAVTWDRIEGVTFPDGHHTVLTNEEACPMLTLKLDARTLPASRQADIGMIYLQKGFRWIPNYRVSIDGNGAAVVKLQATLVNELADMSNVTAHLVVGVPTFAFKDALDHIAEPGHEARERRSQAVSHRHGRQSQRNKQCHHA